MDKKYKGYIRIASRSPFSVVYGVVDTKEYFVRQLCVSHNIKFKVKKVFTNVREPDYVYLFVKIRKKDELNFLKNVLSQMELTCMIRGYTKYTELSEAIYKSIIKRKS